MGVRTQFCGSWAAGTGNEGLSTVTTNAVDERILTRALIHIIHKSCWDRCDGSTGSIYRHCQCCWWRCVGVEDSGGLISRENSKSEAARMGWGPWGLGFRAEQRALSASSSRVTEFLAQTPPQLPGRPYMHVPTHIPVYIAAR